MNLCNRCAHLRKESHIGGLPLCSASMDVIRPDMEVVSCSSFVPRREHRVPARVTLNGAHEIREGGERI